MRFFWILSLSAALILSACSDGTRVFNHLGNTVGVIHMQSDDTAHVENTEGTVMGHVKEGIVRDGSGNRIGRIVSTGNQATIYDRDGSELGGLEDSTNCYSESGQELGRIGATIHTDSAAAGCMLLLILGAE